MSGGRAAAVVLAGGSGARFGAGRNKVYLPLAGRPVIGWSVAVLGAVPEIGPLVLVIRPEDRAEAERVREAAGRTEVELVTGGANRQESELAGLRRLAGPIASGAVDVVLVHDGARPLVSAALVTSVIAAARAGGGAVPGVPRRDLARLAGGADDRLAGPAPGLVAVQTPQGFRAAPLLAAYERAARDGFAGTDTAACVARYTDLPVRGIPGEPSNLKITYAHDLAVAERVLAGG